MMTCTTLHISLRRLQRVSCAIAVVFLLCALFGILTRAYAVPLQDAAVNWSSKLSKLQPSEPMGYFELAEEIADRASDDETRDLARHLFALAGVLDKEGLGRSACLALADLEDNALAKRRLLALASLLDNENQGMLPELRQDSTFDPETVKAVGDALSYYRIGDGQRALTTLREPGAIELLQQFEHVLPGGWSGFESECGRYRGTLRPLLSDTELMTMLQFELSIRDADQKSWAADQVMRRFEPLVEIDPDRLDDSLEIDKTKTLYRNGRWVNAERR